MPFPGIDAARKTFVDDNHFPRFRRHFEFIFGPNFASINVVLSVAVVVVVALSSSATRWLECFFNILPFTIMKILPIA